MVQFLHDAFEGHAPSFILRSAYEKPFPLQKKPSITRNIDGVIHQFDSKTGELTLKLEPDIMIKTNLLRLNRVFDFIPRPSFPVSAHCEVGEQRISVLRLKSRDLNRDARKYEQSRLVISNFNFKAGYGFGVLENGSQAFVHSSTIRKSKFSISRILENVVLNCLYSIENRGPVVKFVLGNEVLT